MIPEVEVDRLCDTITDALDLAAHGRLAEGYLYLDLGLQWAETPPLDLDTGRWLPQEPWWGKLADRYRRALMGYAAEFGLTAEHISAAHLHLSTVEEASAGFAAGHSSGVSTPMQEAASDTKFSSAA
jgi:hypothetical protein